jgi:hypothetical protein
MGFGEGEDTNSLNKELGISSNGSHLPSKAWDPEYTIDPNHPYIAAQHVSKNKPKGKKK